MRFHDPLDDRVAGLAFAIPVFAVLLLVAGALTFKGDPLRGQRDYDRAQLVSVARVLNTTLERDGRLPVGRYPADVAHLPRMSGAPPLIAGGPITVDSDGRTYRLSSEHASWNAHSGFTFTYADEKRTSRN